MFEHRVGIGVACDDLPEELRVGVFAGDRYDAWVRFSSDATPTDPDLKSVQNLPEFRDLMLAVTELLRPDR